MFVLEIQYVIEKKLKMVNMIARVETHFKAKREKSRVVQRKIVDLGSCGMWY